MQCDGYHDRAVLLGDTKAHKDNYTRLDSKKTEKHFSGELTLESGFK